MPRDRQRVRGECRGGQWNAKGLTKSADVKHANEGETKGLAKGVAWRGSIVANAGL